MNEQNYGIPYAMHVHDIEEIIEYGGFVDKVNERLKEGWVLLAIKQMGNPDGYDVAYVMGKPRPKICNGSIFESSPPKHDPKVFEWVHATKQWRCPDCLRVF